MLFPPPPTPPPKVKIIPKMRLKSSSNNPNPKADDFTEKAGSGPKLVSLSTRRFWASAGYQKWSLPDFQTKRLF